MAREMSRHLGVSLLGRACAVERSWEKTVEAKGLQGLDGLDYRVSGFKI